MIRSDAHAHKRNCSVRCSHMCFALVRDVVRRPPSLSISLSLSEMLRDIKVMLQANKVFKAPGVAVQGAAGWGEDTHWGPAEDERVMGKLRREEAA